MGPGIRNIILEVDSADTVALIRDHVNEAHADRQLVEEIQSMQIDR